MTTMLTGKQKRFLRGLGHRIKSHITVGKNGVGDTLLNQVEDGLLAHELIKIRVLDTSPLEKAACADAITSATGAALAQMLGHTLLIYRPHPENPMLELPPGNTRQK